jgi:hypothetical protein
MRNNKSRIGSMLMGLAMGAALFLGALTASASDKLHLKDGRVLEGKIIREVDGYVQFTQKIAGIEQTQMYKPSDIAKIERDTPDAPAAEGKKEIKAADTSSIKHAGAPRAAVITLGEKPEKEMVGQYITAKSLEDCIPLLEKENVDVVVLRISSGGGMLLEIQRLSDVIENKLKPKFRTVAWIDWAISAAAMTSHCLDEIYMTKGGAYGACTGWHGALIAVKDRQLEDVLYTMEKISARGHKDPKIMRSMEIMDPLSCSIDDNGDVKWYQDETSGDFLVNHKGKILCFNSQQAEKFRFSKGTADSIDELGKLMGYQEIQWVGAKKAGTPWPVCKAEEAMMKFRDQTFEDAERTNEYFLRYQAARDLAKSQPDKKDKAKFVAYANKALDDIEGMLKNNPNMAIILGALPEQIKEWLEEQRQILRDIMK